MQPVDIGDIELAYEQRGRGKDLLLVAGIPGTARDWWPFAERLVDSFTVTAFDNRGSGEAEKPEDYYSIEGMADDAAGLIAALGLEDPHVFGISMGGMIAQELAINHADTISKLVLGCTHCGGEQVVPPAADVNEAFGYDGDDWARRIELLAPHAFAPDFPEAQPDVYEEFVETKAADPQPLFAYRRQLGAVARHDTSDRLDAIQARALVLTGTDDAVIPAENSDHLHSLIPDSRLEHVDGAGHLFIVEKPDETAEILRSFLTTDGAA